MSEVQVIPAILTSNADDLAEKIRSVDQLVDRVQIDVVGRVFSSEVSVGIEALEPTDAAVSLDVQLMVREPVSFLNRCDWVGVSRVFGHVEFMRDQQDFIEHAFSLGMEVGLAVDLPTPISMIKRTIEQLDAVLLMAVPAGKSGQKFDRIVLGKIREVSELRPDIPICVDGGINPANIRSCVEAGANEFAVGSYLWESKDIKKALEKLLEASL
jgi:ribulose-phosphate 3-epimerase